MAEIKPSLTVIDGFPVAVTSDMGFADDASDMGTGVAERRRWTQSELERFARRARLGVTPDRLGGKAVTGVVDEAELDAPTTPPGLPNI
jgi:hypothetical protein